MPKISVIVPIYKNEKFLKKCIESIINQTYSNLEILLIDDGSPDNCGNICDEYAEKDSRIKVIHKENGGVSSARNIGLDIATGEYIAFVDSNDYIDSTMYENLISIALDNNADIIDSGYRFYRPWKNTNKILEGPNTKRISVYNNIQALHQFYFGPQRFSEISVMPVTKLYKRTLLKNIRFFEGYRFEDTEFIPRVLYKANTIVKYEQPFYTYNIHLGPDSFTGSKQNKNKIYSSIYMRKRVSDFFKTNYIDIITEHTHAMYIDGLLNGYYECLSCENDKSLKNTARKIHKTIKTMKKEIKTSTYIKRKWRYNLFFISPFLYVTFRKILHFIKKAKYTIRVILTGRN